MMKAVRGVPEVNLGFESIVTSWVGGAAAVATFFGIPGIRCMFGWRTDCGRRIPLRMTRPAGGAARWND